MCQPASGRDPHLTAPEQVCVPPPEAENTRNETPRELRSKASRELGGGVLVAARAFPAFLGRGEALQPQKAREAGEPLNGTRRLPPRWQRSPARPQAPRRGGGERRCRPQSARLEGPLAELEPLPCWEGGREGGKVRGSWLKTAGPGVGGGGGGFLKLVLQCEKERVPPSPPLWVKGSKVEGRPSALA